VDKTTVDISLYKFFFWVELRLRQLRSLAWKIFLVGYYCGWIYGLEHLYMRPRFVTKSPSLSASYSDTCRRCLTSEYISDWCQTPYHTGLHYNIMTVKRDKLTDCCQWTDGPTFYIIRNNKCFGSGAGIKSGKQLGME